MHVQLTATFSARKVKGQESQDHNNKLDKRKGRIKGGDLV